MSQHDYVRKLIIALYLLSQELDIDLQAVVPPSAGKKKKVKDKRRGVPKLTVIEGGRQDSSGD